MKTAHWWIAMGLAALAGCGQVSQTSEDGAKPDPQHEDGKHAEESEHAEGGEGEQHARITPDAATNAGIELGEAGPQKLRESIPLYGVVVANAERTRNVSARFAGVVRTVTKTIGDPVRAGTPLATIESNDSLQIYTLTAPIAGVITARNVNPGEAVSDQSLFTITDLSSVWVEISAFPREMAKIRPGQLVQVKSTDGGLAGSGRIALVSAVGTAATQSTSARVVLENANRQWTPGLYVAAEVVLSETHVPVAVKSAALQNLDGNRVVFVTNAAGFEPRTLRVGRTDGEVTEVLEGLNAGERYVVANSFVVKSEIEKAGASHDH